MATILIVEDDGLIAQQIAHTVRHDGHSPVLARDALAAVREALLRPELILLDLGLPDVPGEELLDHFHQMPETAHTPVVVVTGMPDSAARLQERKPPGLAGVLLKPVTGTRLSRTVRTALATPRNATVPAASADQESLRRNAILRLIAEGPDELARQVYRRLCAHQDRAARPDSPRPLAWSVLATWGLRAGVVNETEARLIGDPPVMPPPGRAGGGPKSPDSPRAAGTRKRAARQAAS